MDERSLTPLKINNAVKRHELVFSILGEEIIPIIHARRQGVLFQVQLEKEGTWVSSEPKRVFILKAPTDLVLAPTELSTRTRTQRNNSLAIALYLMQKKCF